ncbi:Mu transposase C-terminal domain-containing protein [Zavarzinia sp.]|uniref:Mu transposase C-terminal domain-containing protein n=1 Tax=Zavarzinia sp. TaxID=2027920 RepID=UPI00356A66B9
MTPREQIVFRGHDTEPQSAIRVMSPENMTPCEQIARSDRLPLTPSLSAASTSATAAGDLSAGRCDGFGLWLPVAVAAELLGKSAATIRRELARYDSREVAGRGGRGGVVVEINLFSLPKKAQTKYLAVHGPAITPVDGDARLAEERYLASLPAWARAGALKKLASINEWKEFAAARGNPAGTVALMDEFCIGKDFSRTSLYRWIHELTANGGASALVDAYGNRAGYSALTADDKKELVRIYCVLQQSKAQAYDRLIKLYRQRREMPPSASAVHAYLGSVEMERARTYHAGPKTFERKYDPSLRLRYDDALPMDVATADHHKLDIHCKKVTQRDKAGRPVRWVIYRPQLTAFHDAKARRFLGTEFSHHPNGETINRAFYKMASRFGVPKTIKFDWGKDFTAKHFLAGSHHPKFKNYRSSELKGLFALLDVEFTAVAPFHGQSKVIERHFKQVANEFARKWPTYCGKDAASVPELLRDTMLAGERELKNGIDTALIPTIEQVEAEFARWVETEYHNTVQNGDGMNGRSPNQVWNEEIGLTAVRKPAAEILRYFLMRKSTLVTRDGLEICGNLYRAPEICGDVCRRVHVYYDPDDLAKIYVHDEKDAPLCVALADKRASQFQNEGQYRSIMNDRKAARKLARDLSGARISLKERELELRLLRAEGTTAARDDNPTPAAPPVIDPMFGTDAGRKLREFAEYEMRAAANAPAPLPDGPSAGELAGEMFRSITTEDAEKHRGENPLFVISTAPASGGQAEKTLLESDSSARTLSVGMTTETTRTADRATDPDMRWQDLYQPTNQTEGD